MKVALVNPGRNEEFAVQEPLNIGLIASYLLAHDIDAIIIDELAGDSVEEMLASYAPDIVGLTATTPLILDAYRIADWCKGRGIFTVIGGVHATILPEEALQHADIVVKGEGEVAMLDIVRKVDIDSRIIQRPYIRNLDEIPPAARHLMNMDFYLRTKDRLPETYLYFVPAHVPTAAMLTSRGCPYNCTFCHNIWRDTPCRFNSPRRVVSEMKDLISLYGVEAVFFIEDNFFLNKKRVKGICDLIKQEEIDIIWGGNARVDGIDAEILAIARDAGCRQVTFGFESGSQRILDVLNKKTTVEQNRQAIELCRQAGIIPQGTFMIGNPTETMDDLQATVKLVQESGLESAGVCFTTPYPGTELWEWCRQQGSIPEKVDWSELVYDQVPIEVCTSVPFSELQKIRLAIDRITFLRKNTPLSFKEAVSYVLHHPVRFLVILASVLGNPNRFLRIIRRVKL
jgi:radical SAM superfamily enzyme YgiQ (UPF0313 family)